MEDIIFYLLITILGVLGSIVGAVTAGGAIIPFSFLIFSGVPTHIIFGSFKLASLGHFSGTFLRYNKHKKIVWEFVIPLTIIAMIGAFIGTYIVISINEVILNKLVGIGLLTALPFIFLRKELGTKHKKITKREKILGHIGILFMKVWSNVVPLGAGFISTFVIIKAYGLTIIEAKATGALPILISNIIALIIFISASYIDYKIGIALLVGNFIGATIGAHITIKKGDIWVKDMIMIVMVLFAIKMIFF